MLSARSRFPSEYSRENGKHENTPIGFRWSDDDGETWSEAKLIRPINDPEFRGMSVTRMCETDSGAWLLGSHAADWSKKPLETQQYILRSEDQGQTWTLLPAKPDLAWMVRSGSSIAWMKGGRSTLAVAVKCILWLAPQLDSCGKPAAQTTAKAWTDSSNPQLSYTRMRRRWFFISRMAKR